MISMWSTSMNSLINFEYRSFVSGCCFKRVSNCLYLLSACVKLLPSGVLPGMNGIWTTKRPVSSLVVVSVKCSMHSFCSAVSFDTSGSSSNFQNFSRSKWISWDVTWYDWIGAFYTVLSTPPIKTHPNNVSRRNNLSVSSSFPLSISCSLMSAPSRMSIFEGL